ncbi:MAG: aldehyde dehydrogenase family protein [Chlorobi bacterium]|nr:aldehyde dehydrogenase family protein [Chlorobiota bacterium]
MSSHIHSPVPEELKTTFRSGITRPAAWRRSQLFALLRFLREREGDIAAAVREDLGKSPAETFLTETSFLSGEIRHALKHLGQWMSPSFRHVPLHYLFGKGAVYAEPYGVVLVIGAWNYPLQLVLGPLVSALAAGNCVVLKPSELAPQTSALLARSLSAYLDPLAVRVVEGGAAETAALLENRFDFIFHTGIRSSGREVMLAAARHTVPVALELGGKNPCIVERNASLRTAARRIVWAKFLNAGQTCIAPDYLLVHKDAEAELLSFMQQAIRDFFGADPSRSTDYSRIVNDRHFARLERLLQGCDVFAGGQTDRNLRYVAPTIIRGVMPESPLMQSEIFGPLLPVMTYGDIDDALAFIRERDDPLAVYLFSPDPSVRDKVRCGTRSGSFCSNDLLFQSAIHQLPFGGTGMSGFGRYHGKAGFETFSVMRSVLYKSVFPDPNLRYPPYVGNRFRLLRAIVRFFG